MIITTCLIWWIPVVVAVGAVVEALVDRLVRDAPLDEHPTDTTVITTTTIPTCRHERKRIRRTLRAQTDAPDAANMTRSTMSASCEPTELADPRRARRGVRKPTVAFSV